MTQDQFEQIAHEILDEMYALAQGHPIILAVCGVVRAVASDKPLLDLLYQALRNRGII